MANQQDLFVALTALTPLDPAGSLPHPPPLSTGPIKVTLAFRTFFGAPGVDTEEGHMGGQLVPQWGKLGSKANHRHKRGRWARCTEEGELLVYRLLNPRAQDGTHFFSPTQQQP